mmetsp:Transcript_11498/g.37784  ORF Transcript_11498/g.37784 Transcript_11498/m.37784 type:complete len:104 (-) Transcript_11498:86-397(-)
MLCSTKDRKRFSGRTRPQHSEYRCHHQGLGKNAQHPKSPRSRLSDFDTALDREWGPLPPGNSVMSDVFRDARLLSKSATRRYVVFNERQKKILRTDATTTFRI